MTKEEIIQRWNSLSPRERDAWIAETVMGWTHIQKIEHPVHGEIFRGVNPEHGYAVPVLEYTTRINAAWEVEGKALDKKPVGYATALLIATNISEWKLTPETIIGISRATSAQRCLAALIAHYEEESE